jgi:hypothetical protein
MALITVRIDNKQYGDAWYSYEGGELEADDSKTRPGGMGDEVSIGGPASREDIELTIQLTDTVIGWHKTLENKVREDAPVEVGITYLNRLKQPVGSTFTRTGTLKKAALPNADSGSSDASMYSIVMSADELGK